VEENEDEEEANEMDVDQILRDWGQSRGIPG
jgi:hypothetical protein